MGVMFFVAINQGILGTIGVLQVMCSALELLSVGVMACLVWNLS